MTIEFTMVEEMDTGEVGNPIPAKPESAGDSEATGIFFGCRSGKSEFEPAIKEVAPTLNPEFPVAVKLCGIPAEVKQITIIQQTTQNKNCSIVAGML